VEQEEHVRKRIGPVGTIVRVVVGAVFLAPALSGTFAPSEWLLGLVGYPAILLFWQWIRTRRDPTPISATGPVGFALNLAAFLGLYLTPIYFSALAVTSDSALVFYGTSMLLAAARGYRGCELLAVSNWLLHRDDQIGCVIFSPVDLLERRLRGSRVIDPEM
jgi:hypothetical protein